jgi:2-aminoadipate transaminase
MKSSEFSELARRTGEPPISWLMRLTLDHPGLISLAAGFTDNASLPVGKTLRLIENILTSSKSSPAALQYGSTAGHPQLRRLTAHDLEVQDGHPDSQTYDFNRVLITHGSQQALYLISECLCNPGDIVLVEDPSYFVFFGIAQSHGVHCRGVAMDDDGLNIEALDQALARLKQRKELHRVKMLYLVSYFQNPSGITTSFRKKQQALQLLRRYEKHAGHPIYLLEDAAYRELRFYGADVPSSLAVEGSSDRVLYTGTYSKPFATGIRIGFAVLPKRVFEVTHRLKGNHDFGTSNLLQHIMAQALASGEYEEHLPELHYRYARKAHVMTQAMREHFPPDVHWLEPSGGLYVWARLPARLKTGPQSPLFQKALHKGVLFVPGQLCYAEDPTRRKPNHEMRLSFGGAAEQDISEGIARLGKLIKRMR